MTQFIRSRRWRFNRVRMQLTYFRSRVYNSSASANMELWLIGFPKSVLFTPATFTPILGVLVPPVRSSLCIIFGYAACSLRRHCARQCHCTSAYPMSSMWLTHRFVRYLLHVTCAGIAASCRRIKCLIDRTGVRLQVLILINNVDNQLDATITVY